MIDIHNAPRNEIHAEKHKFIRYSVTTLLRCGIKTENQAMEITNALLALYSGEDRHYHTYSHVNDLFDNAGRYFPAKDLGMNCLEPSEMLGILFHDVAYIAGQVDNEGRSGDLMIAMMASYGVPLTEWDWSYQIIKHTADYLNFVEDTRCHAVLDLDLAGFALPWRKFLAMNKLVEKEFPGVPHTKRAEFLTNFLEKDRIYYVLTELEEPARMNIHRYIGLLKNLG